MVENNLPQMIIAAVSGSTDQQHQDLTYKSGMNYCLFKPLEPIRINKLLDNLCFTKEKGEESKSFSFEINEDEINPLEISGHEE